MSDNKEIRLYYISPRDILKARVDPIMIMKTCDKFIDNGINVTLVYPNYFRRNNLKKSEIWNAYQIFPNKFNLLKLPTILWDNVPVFWMRFNKFFFNLIVSLFLLIKFIFSFNSSINIIYSKCLISALPYILILNPFKNFLNIRLVFELHTFRNNSKHRFVLKYQDNIICISESLRKIMCDSIKYNIEKTDIARHSVNPMDYDNKTKEFCRKECNLPDGKFIITYTGKVYYGMKEIDYIIETAKLLKDIIFIIVGGKEDEIQKFIEKCNSEEIKNVLFPGFVNMEKVQQYQIASDVLVLYYPGDWPIKDFLSPGKMIEYMATGNAIITVNFKALTEVLINEQNALVIEPDNPQLLAEAISRLKNDTVLLKNISKNAKKDSFKYSWDLRAGIILNKILEN
jgi:glycosyltransferase involved in cell wall biosynthesis